jgi:hypothetical protein
MATLHRAYTSPHDAEDAIERLLSAGVPAIRIELITGSALDDARNAPIGTFAGTTTADALTVGSFADIAHSGRDAIGTFAGDPDTQRRGAFSDTDRDTVTTHQRGVKQSRVATHRGLEKLLIGAGMDQAMATANVGALHAGRVLVLVHSESALDEIAAVMDDLGHAPDLRSTLPAAA